MTPGTAAISTEHHCSCQEGLLVPDSKSQVSIRLREPGAYDLALVQGVGERHPPISFPQREGGHCDVSGRDSSSFCPHLLPNSHTQALSFPPSSEGEVFSFSFKTNFLNLFLKQISSQFLHLASDFSLSTPLVFNPHGKEFRSLQSPPQRLTERSCWIPP